MVHFCADHHFGEKNERLHLYGRDILGLHVSKVEKLMIKNHNRVVAKSDCVYFLGDVAVSLEGLKQIKKMNGYKILILGNYERKMITEYGIDYTEYFDEVHDTTTGIKLGGLFYTMVHEPENVPESADFAIVGHIHGLWRVQRKMINVGVDAWMLHPISEKRLVATYGGVANHYDVNVFAGELPVNRQ